MYGNNVVHSQMNLRYEHKIISLLMKSTKVEISSKINSQNKNNRSKISYNLI